MGFPAMFRNICTVIVILLARTDVINGKIPEDVCNFFKTVDCNLFRPRVICGSDGTTYANECHFSKAHCINPTLTVTYDGKGCFATDTPTSHPAMTTPSHLLSTVSVVDLSCNITNHLNCDDYVPKWICASNGQIYRTDCDFAKDHCKDTSLQVMPDGQTCSVTTPTTTGVIDTTKTQTRLKTTWTRPTPIPDSTVKPVTRTTITQQTATTTERSVVSGKPVTHTTQISYMVPSTGDKYTTQKTNTLSTAKTDTTSRKMPSEATKPVTTFDKTEIHKTQATPTATTSKLVTTEKVATHPQDTTTASTIPDVTVPTKSAFDFLCRVLMSSACKDNLNVVCSTNGNYRNTCEYQKAKCIDPSIHRIHDGFCGVGEGFPSNPSSHEIVCQTVLNITCPSDGPVVCDNHGEVYPNLCVLEKTKCLIHGIESADCSSSS